MSNVSAQPIIDGMRKNRERFESFCQSLSEEELARPVPPDNKWTVKDFVIHNLTFDDLTTGWMESVIAGNTRVPAGIDGKAIDLDEWNNQRVAERRSLTMAELLERSAPERKAFEDVLVKLTEEQMKAVIGHPGDNKRDPAKVPVGLFLQGLVRHDPVHVVDMLKALPERASDPELAAWVDDRMVDWYQKAMSGPAKR